jgi:hypothetical protein
MRISLDDYRRDKSIPLSPISLFVYNRLDHTRRTVEALLNNPLASESILYIFSDGAKDEKSENSVAAVRSYIQSIAGFKKIIIRENEANRGLAHSIISGVSEVVDEHGKIIVLEDDLVTSPSFLSFMNIALDHYREEERVMHVSGYNFPAQFPQKFQDASGFFYRSASCWGWGTWSRAWRWFKKEPEKLKREFSKSDIFRFNIDGTVNFWSQVERNIHGQINSWAIFWYASVFKRQGLCFHPILSLVNNIGLDGSGVHCAETDRYYNARLYKKFEFIFPDRIEEDQEIIDSLKAYYRKTQPSLYIRLKSKIKKIMSG